MRNKFKVGEKVRIVGIWPGYYSSPGVLDALNQAYSKYFGKVFTILDNKRPPPLKYKINLSLAWPGDAVFWGDKELKSIPGILVCKQETKK